MFRTFHAKTPVSIWLLLAILVMVTGYAAWRKEAVLLALALVLITLLIERIIHTEYVVQDGKLHIRKGRFTKTQTIDIGQIRTIDQASGMRIGGKALTTFLIISLQEGQDVMIMPKDQTGFIDQIYKQRYRNRNENE